MFVCWWGDGRGGWKKGGFLLKDNVVYTGNNFFGRYLKNKSLVIGSCDFFLSL